MIDQSDGGWGKTAARSFPGLAGLIAPLDVETFFAEHYEKMRLIARKPVGGRELPLELSDIDQVLAMSSIRSEDLRVVADGRETPVSELAEPGDATALELLYDCYRNGSTIVFKFLHERWEPLRRLCQQLTTEFSARAQVNVYLTPPSARGLKPHFDTHDVFVLQVGGSKHWRLYDSPYPLPVRGQTYAEYGPADGPGAPVEEFDLDPGDLLYLPRGYVHDASSADQASLHLTIGILPMLWSSVIADAVDLAMRSDVRFRRTLPPGFASDAELQARCEATAGELLDAVARVVAPAELVARARTRAGRHRQPELRGHLLDLAALGSLDTRTPVRRRDRLECTVSTSDDRVCLEFHGKQIRLPAHVSEELRFVLGEPGPFSAAQIPGRLDEAGRSVLVTTLVREGLLTLDQAGAGTSVR